MSEYKTIRLDEVEVDYSIQPRVNGLNQDHVDDLEQAYRDETTIEPPTVWRLPDDTYRLSQGFHRLEGAKRAGLTELKFAVHKGSETECAIDAMCSNKAHGLKRTTADKERCVERLLKLVPDYSDRRIAEMAEVSHTMVANHRTKANQLATLPVEPDQKRTGKDGKSRSATQPVVKRNATAATTSANPTTTPEPVNQPEPASDGKATGVHVWAENQSQEETAPEPKLPKAYQNQPRLDPRFMPNATEAKRLVPAFLNWKARLESVRAEMLKALPVRTHVMAKRLDLHDKFESYIACLIETIDKNLPELPCPCCCGVGKSELAVTCRYCQGYGVVDRSAYDGLKAQWQKTEKRLELLREKADAEEAA